MMHGQRNIKKGNVRVT